MCCKKIVLQFSITLLQILTGTATAPAAKSASRGALVQHICFLLSQPPCESNMDCYFHFPSVRNIYGVKKKKSSQKLSTRNCCNWLLLDHSLGISAKWPESSSSSQAAKYQHSPIHHPFASRGISFSQQAKFWIMRTKGQGKCTQVSCCVSLHLLIYTQPPSHWEHVL